MHSISHPLLVVFGYSPTKGDCNVSIVADVELTHPPFDVRLRLVLGRTALATFVDRRPGAKRSSTRWQVSAVAPEFEATRYSTRTNVPLTLQVMKVEASDVLETVRLGFFSYTDPVHRLLCSNAPNSKSLKPEHLKEEPTFDKGLESPFLKKASVVHNEVYFVPTMAKFGTAGSTDDCSPSQGESYSAVLEWVVTELTPHPDAFATAWSKNDLYAGRRLVRFQRAQSGHKLLVTCTAIKQDEYVGELDIVISCIVRPQTHNCFFTSVDIIYLLERLVGVPFMVEEKNRIRRNLEGFKPLTVSKSKAGQERFFQRIMDFPPPKPRNIEKDVKVFSWDVLSPALSKIISKYSLYAVNESLQVETRPGSADYSSIGLAANTRPEMFRSFSSPLPSPSSDGHLSDVPVPCPKRDYSDMDICKPNYFTQLQSSIVPPVRTSQIKSSPPSYSLAPSPSHVDVIYPHDLAVPMNDDSRYLTIGGRSLDNAVNTDWHPQEQQLQICGEDYDAYSPLYTGQSTSGSSCASSPSSMSAYMPSWLQTSHETEGLIPCSMLHNHDSAMSSPSMVYYPDDEMIHHQLKHSTIPTSGMGDSMMDELEMNGDVYMYAPGAYSVRPMSPVC